MVMTPKSSLRLISYSFSENTGSSSPIFVFTIYCLEISSFLVNTLSPSSSLSMKSGVALPSVSSSSTTKLEFKSSIYEGIPSLS